MKSKIMEIFRSKLLIVLFFIATSTFLISLAFIQFELGPHGGNVKNAGPYNIELKNSYPEFYVFLLDKNNTPIKNHNISCEAKFIFADNKSYSSTLIPFGDDGFYGEVISSNYYLCKINFNVRGKSISTVFENDITIVRKK